MITFLIEDENGEKPPVLVVGIVRENVRRMALRQPIWIQGHEQEHPLARRHGAPRIERALHPQTSIAIVFAPTHLQLVQYLRSEGMTLPDRAEADALLADQLHDSSQSMN